MNIIIVGAGRHGFFLAKNLLESGYNVKIIDSDKDRCEKIATTLDVGVFCGDGTTLETLSNAGVGKCEVLIAATGKDEDNLIACEIAKKQFNVKRTISKINNNKNVALMKKLGIDIVLDTTKLMTQLIEHEIDGAQVQLIADIGSSNAVISEYDIPLKWSKSGKKVMELDVPEDCVLVYMKRGGIFMIPRGNSILMAGDTVVALTVGSASKQLKKLFEI